MIRLPLFSKFSECFALLFQSIVTNNTVGNTMFSEYLLDC